MTKRPLRLIGYTALLALVAPHLTGCIAEDIRKELVAANQSLTTTNEIMRKLTYEEFPQRLKTLDEVKLTLNETQTVLVQVRAELQQTNTTMTALQSQLKRMDTIDASLVRLDVHLASLRETLQKIDETIPFLSLSSSTTQPTTLPTTQPTTPPDASPTPTAPASK